MIRIVQVVHDFLPEHPFGTENYTYHLSKELQKTGKIYIFSRGKKDFYGKGLSKDELFDGIPVRRLYYNTPPTFEATYQNSFVDKEFELFLQEVKPDIVHFQHLLGLSASMVDIVKRRLIPTVLTLHDFWFLCPQIQLLTNNNQVCSGPDSKVRCADCRTTHYKYGKLQASKSSHDRRVKFLKYPPEPLKTLKKLVPSKVKSAFKEKFLKAQPAKPSITPKMIGRRSSFLRNILNKIDVVLAPSKFLREKFIHYGRGKDRIIHLGYGVDHRPLLNFRKEPSGKFRFGFVGNVSEHKGIRVLIKAFNKIGKNNVSLSIFGPCEPPYFDKLKKELKMDTGITFFGPFDNKDLSSIFSKIDALVYPSIWYENQPIAILEALIAKIPVITSNLGGMAELVQDRITGLLFETGNSDDLSQKMLRLINDAGLFRKLSETPRQVKTIEKNAEELNKIYDSLLEKATR